MILKYILFFYFINQIFAASKSEINDLNQSDSCDQKKCRLHLFFYCKNCFESINYHDYFKTNYPECINCFNRFSYSNIKIRAIENKQSSLTPQLRIKETKIDHIKINSSASISSQLPSKESSALTQWKKIGNQKSVNYSSTTKKSIFYNAFSSISHSDQLTSSPKDGLNTIQMKTDPSESSLEDTITEEILESTLLTTNLNTESNLSTLFTNKTTIFDKKTTTLQFSNPVGSSTSGTFKSSTQLITNSYEKLESKWIINTTNSAILAIYKNDLIIVNNSHFGIFDLQTGASKSFFEHDLLEPCVFGVIFNERLVIGDCFNLSLNIWYIDKLNDQSTKILQTNSRYKFLCLTVLINGDLAIGWNDNFYDIMILDSYKGSQKYTLVGHNDKVNQILQRKDEYIISSSIDKTVIIWDSSGSLIKKLEYQESVISIAISNYLIAVGLADNVIEVVNLKNGRIINSFQAHQQQLCKHQCLFFLDDKSLLSASLDKTLKIWNPGYNSLNTTIFLHTTDVEQLFFKFDLLFSRSSTEIIKWSIAE